MEIFRLNDKRAAVIGTAGGIGRAIAIRFAHAGTEVILLDLNADSANGVAAEVASETSRSGSALACDVSEESSVAIAATCGLSDRFAYSMSKGAVLAMTLSVAKDCLPLNIRCNCISPARVHTPFVDGFLAGNYPGQQLEMMQKLSSRPTRRVS